MFRTTDGRNVVLAVAAALLLAAPATALATPGAQDWVQRFPGVSPGHGDFPASVGVSPDGSRVFVTGGGLDVVSTSDDYLTQAYDAGTGAPVWSKRFDGSAEGADIATGLAVSPDGTKIFVVGRSIGSPGTNYDFVTVAYRASDGARLWAKRYDGAGTNGSDDARAIAVSADGTKVFVVGGSATPAGDSNYTTIAYATQDGARLWLRQYDGTGHNDEASALAVSPDSAEVFVTGESQGASGGGTDDDYATVAYATASGARQWVRRYDGPPHSVDLATGVAVAPDGSKVFVTGTSLGSSDSNDFLTIAYSPAGARLWAQRFDGAAHFDDDAAGLAVSPDSSKVFVAGQSPDASGRPNYLALAYDAATGHRTWVARAVRGGIPAAIAATPDGSSVILTGQVSDVPAGPTDYATAAFTAATGARQWVTRYDDGHNDEAVALAVRPDSSKVFVTGASDRSGTPDFDFATISYLLS